MRKHVPITIVLAGLAALVAIPVLNSTAAEAGPPKCEGGGFVDEVVATGPGRARIDASFLHCSNTIDSVVAFGEPGTPRVVLFKGGSTERSYTVSREVELPVGTRRVCGVAYADWADICMKVTVEAGADGKASVPVVGKITTMRDTATGTSPVHPPGVPMNPDPLCPTCW